MYQYDKKPAHQRSDEENESQDNEAELAGTQERDFWNPVPEPSQLSVSQRTFGAILIGLIIGGLGFWLMVAIPSNQGGALVLIGVLIGILSVVNVIPSMPAAVLRLSRYRRKYTDISPIEPVEQLSYYLSAEKDVLLVEDKRHIIGLGLLRMRAIPRRLRGDFERLIRDLYRMQTPMFWGYTQVPGEMEDIVNDNEILIEETRQYYKTLTSDKKEAKAEDLGGMWLGRLIIGTHFAIPTHIQNEAAVHTIIQTVKTNLQKVSKSINLAYPHIILEPLVDNELVKSHQILMAGGGKISFVATGLEIAETFIQIPKIAKKSIASHPAAEFNTPTKLSFDFQIGQTWETECEGKERPVGLYFADLQKGLLVVGGTTEQRFLTNLKIVYESLIQEKNYLIITTNPAWRRLLDLWPTACVLRLGDDLTVNPMDSENTADYLEILSEAFAQTFHLSNLGFKQLQNEVKACMSDTHSTPTLAHLKDKLQTKLMDSRAGSNIELETICQFLQSIEYNKIATVMGGTMIPIEDLLKRTTILEIDLEGHLEIQFLSLCLIAKVLAHVWTHPKQEGLLLIDIEDYIAPIGQQNYRVREAAPYLLNWIRIFKKREMGLHLSLPFPSQLDFDLLKTFEVVLAHKLTFDEDMRLMYDLLQFSQDQQVHSQARKVNWQPQYLKKLKPNMLMTKLHSKADPFPIERIAEDLNGTHIWIPEELQHRLNQYMPTWKQPQPKPRSQIEQNFGERTPIVLSLLALLMQYETLSNQGLLSALNSDPRRELDMEDLNKILSVLVKEDYIVPNEWDDGYHHQHYSYQLKGRGRELYENHLETLKKELENAATKIGNGLNSDNQH